MRGLVFFTMVLLLSRNAVFAHAVLLRSTPAAHASVAGSDDAIQLEFSSRIDASRSALLLVGPQGTTPVTLLPQARANLLGGKRRPLPLGDYLIRWQVLATDGHVTRGEIPFVVR